jgi:hypothetical protein
MWSRRRILSVSVLCVVILTSSLALISREPTYNGRSASAWIRDLPLGIAVESGSVTDHARFAELPGPGQTQQSMDEEKKAVQAMGSQVVPILIENLREEGSLSRWTSKVATQFPDLFVREPAGHLMLKSMAGLRSIGREAMPAVQVLLKGGDRPVAHRQVLWLLRDLSIKDKAGFLGFLEELGRTAEHEEVRYMARKMLLDHNRHEVDLW